MKTHFFKKKQFIKKLKISAPLEPILKIEERMQKKDIKGCNNPLNKNEDMVTYFEGEIRESKKRSIYKALPTIIEVVGTFVTFAANSIFVYLSNIGFELMVIPMSTGLAGALMLPNNFSYEIMKNKNDNFEKHYVLEKEGPTVNLLFF